VINSLLYQQLVIVDIMDLFLNTVVKKVTHVLAKIL